MLRLAAHSHVGLYFNLLLKTPTVLSNKNNNYVVTDVSDLIKSPQSFP